VSHELAQTARSQAHRLVSTEDIQSAPQKTIISPASWNTVNGHIDGVATVFDDRWLVKNSNEVACLRLTLKDVQP
jgi:hypothetical protein